MKITQRGLIKEETKGQKRDFILRGLPSGSIGVVAGSGGSGKGFFLLNMLDNKDNILNNDDIQNLKPRKIAFLNFEDDILTISSRLGDTTHHHWDFVDCIGMSLFDEIKDNGVHKRILNMNMFSLLSEYDLIIVDTWALASGIDENDNSTTSKAMRSIKKWLAKNKSVMLIVHHTSKSGMSAENEAGTGQVRGASALTDNARLAVLIYPSIVIDGKQRKFSKTEVTAEIVKANYTTKDEQEYTRGDRGILRISNPNVQGMYL